MNAMRREVKNIKINGMSRAEKYIICNSLHVCNSSYALQKTRKMNLNTVRDRPYIVL